MSERKFDGPVYVPLFDENRLTGQIKRIFTLMIDGYWRTLEEISLLTGDPPASISAQLRHLRKEKFGSHTVNKRPRGERQKGLWAYQLIINKDTKGEELSYFGDYVYLNCSVSKERWREINEMLNRKGYVYVSKRRWVDARENMAPQQREEYGISADYGENTQ